MVVQQKSSRKKSSVVKYWPPNDGQRDCYQINSGDNDIGFSFLNKDDDQAY